MADYDFLTRIPDYASQSSESFSAYCIDSYLEGVFNGQYKESRGTLASRIQLVAEEYGLTVSDAALQKRYCYRLVSHWNQCNIKPFKAHRRRIDWGQRRKGVFDPRYGLSAEAKNAMEIWERSFHKEFPGHKADFESLLLKQGQEIVDEAFFQRFLWSGVRKQETHGVRRLHKLWAVLLRRGSGLELSVELKRQAQKTQKLLLSMLCISGRGVKLPRLEDVTRIFGESCPGLVESIQIERIAARLAKHLEASFPEYIDVLRTIEV